MKYRIIATLILIAVLAGVVFVFEGRSSGASFNAPSDFDDAKSFKIN